MKARSNVRCFLPKSEATKLLVVFQQIEQIMQAIAKERHELADKECQDL